MNRRALLVVALIATTTGCLKKKPASFRYEISVTDSPSLPLLGMKADGQPMKMIRQSPLVKTFELSAPTQEHIVDKTLTVTVTTTCGETELRAKVHGGNAASSEDNDRELATKAQKGVAVPLVVTSAEFTQPVEAMIYVDTDGPGGAAAVEVGTTKITAPSTRVSYGTSCPTAMEVKVAGAAVGVLQTKPRAGGEIGTAFVDVAGGHCYEKVTGADLVVVPLEPARVYSVEIDDFLKPGTKSQIRRCLPKKPAAPPVKKKK